MNIAGVTSVGFGLVFGVVVLAGSFILAGLIEDWLETRSNKR